MVMKLHENVRILVKSGSLRQTARGNVAKKFLWGNGKTNERALIYALPPRRVQ